MTCSRCVGGVGSERSFCHVILLCYANTRCPINALPPRCGLLISWASDLLFQRDDDWLLLIVYSDAILYRFLWAMSPGFGGVDGRGGMIFPFVDG